MAKGTRRDFFSSMVDGLHGTALATLLGADLFNAASARAEAGHIYDLKPKAPHFPAKAKGVIHLFMNGGPSQMDLFDPKPTLKRLAGTAPSRELSFAISNGKVAGTLFPSPFEFKKAGKCGMDISSMLPHISECADDIALIRSMYGEHANHEPALFLMHTGRTISSRPSIGSWVAYGLGTENQNLPAYVVLDDPKGLPINGISNWQSAWLPPIYQGTRFRAEGTPVLNLEPRAEVPAPLVEAERSLLHKLDEAHRMQRPYQPELDARISSYELSARMQLAASDALDVNKETEANSKTAEQEWGRATSHYRVEPVSLAPAINLRPTGAGVELHIRYITRAHERFATRTKLYTQLVELLRKKQLPEAVQSLKSNA